MHSSRAALAVILLLMVVPVQAQPAAIQPADALDGPPLVTAKAWIVGDGRTGQRLWGHDDDLPRPIASTTKIMTAWLVMQLVEQEPALAEQVVTFSERADKTSGSSAGIRAGEQLKIRDLLYGLLLPSGNDAAVALAEHCGFKFATEEVVARDNDASYAAFVARMNRVARSLELEATEYLDPHGLGANKSSSRDLLRLTHAAMQSELFRRCVQRQSHSCTLMTSEGETREVTWNNTNQALRIEGFDGVKTGTTTPAGACLVASCHRADDHLLVIVLGSTSSEGRYVDARNLLRWAWQQRAAKPSR